MRAQHVAMYSTLKHALPIARSAYVWKYSTSTYYACANAQTPTLTRNASTSVRDGFF